MNVLRAHWSDQADFVTFNEKALQSLDHRCGKHFTSLPYFLASAFNPTCDLSSWSDSDRKKLHNAVSSYFVPLLKKYGHDEAVLPALQEQLGQWVQRAGPLTVPPAQNPPLDPSTYWRSISLHVPLLSKVALTIFAIAPSEASVERSFSHQGLVHSDLRASLDDSSVQAVMTVRMNIARFFDVPSIPPNKKQKTE